MTIWYKYNNKKLKRKVHILDNESGVTLCKTENGSAGLNEEEATDKFPENRTVCSLCQNLSKKQKKGETEKLTKQEDIFDIKNFYGSWQWKKLRYAVIKYYGATCMCCGSTPKAGGAITVDHILPVKKYPKLKLDFNNCQVLCKSCNMGKSDNDFTDFRPKKLFAGGE